MAEQIKISFKENLLRDLFSQFDFFKKDELYNLRKKNFYFLQKFKELNLDKETWKYTPFFELIRGASFDFFPFSDKSLESKDNIKFIREALEPLFSRFRSSYFLVFVNGVLNLELSRAFISSKLKIFSLFSLFSKNFSALDQICDLKKEAQSLRKIKSYIVQKIEESASSFQEGFTALNNTFFSNGSVIYLPKEAQIESPIHLIFISGSALTQGGDSRKKDHFFVQQPKNFIFFDSFSKALIFESYLSFSKSLAFTNSKTYFHLSEGSKAHHVRLQKEDVHSFHIGSTDFRLEKEADLKSFCLNLGSRLSHLTTDFDLMGKSASVDSLGIYFPRFSQHMNHSVFFHHRAPFSSGMQYSKGLVLDDSQVVFKGKVKIEKEGDRSYSNQLSKNLVLSPRGEIKTSPQLEVHADDVTATHGATVSQFSKDEILYLRSRGLTSKAALSLLLDGFVRDVFLKVDQGLRENIEGFFRENWSQ